MLKHAHIPRRVTRRGAFRPVDRRPSPRLTPPPDPNPTFVHQGELAEFIDYQSFTQDTQDREDHSFCGVFFDLSPSDELPLSYVEVTSIWVRGDLGPCTIWTTPDGHGGVPGARNPASKVYEQDAWRCVYERDHGPSFDEFVEMRLDEPVRLERGKKTGFYVHSKSQGDRAVVYDDQRYGTRGVVDDGRLVIWPAVAHLSCRPFGRRAPWGGDALRSNRLFVGRVAYGVRWLLWNPEPRCHARFPAGFRQAVETMVLCARRPGCELSRLGDEVIFYIMNKCGWDWFGENMTADGPSFEERKAAEQEAYRAREREERRHALRQMFGEGMSDQEVENLMEQVDDNPNLNYMLLNYLMYGDQDDDDDDGDDDGEAEWDPDDDDDDDDDDDGTYDDDDDGTDGSEDFEEADGGDDDDDEDGEEPAAMDEDA